MPSPSSAKPDSPGIIHIVPAVSQVSSGPSYSVVRLCESLIHHGNSVTLATLNWGEIPSPPPFLKTFRMGAGPKKLGRSPAMNRWLREQVEAGATSILHSHGMWQMNAVYPARAIRGSDTKLVISPRGAFSEWAMQHGSWSKRVFWPLLQRPALQAASCFHATSDAEYRDIRRLGFPQPVAVIPNGIDLPALPDRAARPSRTLLYLGRIHPVKGLPDLLEAWRDLAPSYPAWRLRIAGSDTGYSGTSGRLEDLKTLARDWKLPNIEFLGELTGAEKWKAYHEADLYVLPTRSENFGVTVAESLASAVPVVVTKGAPWSGLEEHQAGWWVDHGVPNLKTALDRAMSESPETLFGMGLRGRAWMEQDYSWPKLGLRMSKVYRWIEGSGPPSPDVRLD